MIASIQILRGLAATMVVLTHMWLTSAFLETFGLNNLGEIGVAIFFAISGFVMANKLGGNTSSQAARTFIWKRLLRIWPVYIIFAGPFIGWYVFKADELNIPEIISNIALLPALSLDSGARMYLGVAWTLVYEMVFYYLLAASMCVFPSRRLVILAVISVIAAAFWIVRWFDFAGEQADLNIFQMFGSGLMFTFCAGLLIGSREHSQTSLLLPWIAAIAAFFFSLTTSISSERFIAFGIPAAIVVFSALKVDLGNGRIVRALVYLGNASYSLYLTHYYALFLKEKFGHFIPPSLLGPLGTAAAIVLGIAAYELIEKPLSARGKPQVVAA